MIKTIILETVDGEREYSFLATAATAHAYMQVFHEDLMVKLNSMNGSNVGVADAMALVPKLAYIMNMQANGTKAATLNDDTYYDWLNDLEPLTIIEHSEEILNVYMTSRLSRSSPKKEAARLTGS